MIADVILAGLFVFSSINGYRKGFVKAIMRFAGLFVFLVWSAVLYKWVSPAFGGGVTGAASVAVSALILSWIIEHFLSKLVKLPLLKQGNKLLGGVLGAINGAFLVIIVCFVFISNESFSVYTKDSLVFEFIFSQINYYIPWAGDLIGLR